jgi:Zn-dependent alcohol dehydrogenase
MKTTAAVLNELGAELSLEHVQLDGPRPDEVLVQIAAVGICHTDIATRDGALPFPLPAVLGHEGSGTVVSAGSDVTKVRPGDRVAISFATCGRCPACAAGSPSYCHGFMALNYAGTHVCVGMHVARLEMKVLFEELLPRIRGIELTGEPRWLKTNFVGGLRSMPVRLIKA